MNYKRQNKFPRRKRMQRTQSQEHYGHKTSHLNSDDNNTHCASDYTESCHKRQGIKSRKKYSSDTANGKTYPRSSSSSHATQESDIPGYYYDEEKKTYFKILPNSLSSVTSFLTKETIRKKEAEQRRQSDLKSYEGKTSTVSRASLQSMQKTRSHLVGVLRDLQCGQFTCENLQTYMIRHTCLDIQPNTGILHQQCPALPHVKLEEIQKMDVSPNSDKLVCVTSLKHCLAHTIQLMSVSEDKHYCHTDRKQTVLTIKPTKYAFGPIFKKISSMCWAPMPSLPGKHTVFLTATCPAGYVDAIAYLVNLDVDMEAAIVRELSLGFKTVWSAAWNSHQSRFSIGSERKCHLVDITTQRKWVFNTNNSDPLSQLFSPTDPSVMYNGTRGGLILTHDLRASGNNKAQAEMKQGEGVGCLRIQRDENYILASDFSGTICSWDKRVCKKMMLYKDLVNSHYQLPFHLDKTETVICSTGSDSYTKLWDARSGELLKSLPPPNPASLEHFPISLFSTTWGNRNGNSAVLVAMKDKFKIYS